MNVAMLLDMAAEGFGDRIVVGRREDGFTAERVRELAAGGGQIVEGRIDDTIIRGAVNFALAEIEDLRQPDVHDAVVVGVPDEEWGQRIEAVVVARNGVTVNAEQLRAAVRHTLRGSKTPDRITCWPELPRTVTGEVVRRDIVATLTSARTAQGHDVGGPAATSAATILEGPKAHGE
jgi:non-ribosomal peptide synthetase component E (peptide arylation enzyme)